MTTTQTRLIGLNGRLHSGKDSAYDALVEIASPRTTKRAAFADKLKMSACAALGIPFTDAADAVHICNMIKEHGKFALHAEGLECLFSGREYLQWYGTEAHRDIFGTNFWVDALLPHWDGLGNTASSIFPGADVVVITDVRFPNEAERILEYPGGQVWHIDAEKRLGPLPEDAHVSEHPLPPHCLTGIIDNNQGLGEFYDNLQVAFHG